MPYPYSRLNCSGYLWYTTPVKAWSDAGCRNGRDHPLETVLLR